MDINNANSVVNELNRKLDDNGWIDLITPQNSLFVKYRKKNGFVTVSGQSLGHIDVGGSEYKSIAILPEDCRPKTSIGFAICNMGGSYAQASYVSTSGDVFMWTSATTASYWRFFVTYPV